MKLIRLHQGGDWGNVCNEFREANELAVKNSGEIISQYRVQPNQGFGTDVVIMTEADRSYTVVFFEDDPTEGHLSEA